MRIVAGSARGRRIVAPQGLDTRPTTDRVREALFNSLGSLGAVVDARVLDAFAGSGALGLEALSRGAAHVTFVEHDHRARHAVEANLATLGFADRATVIDSDVHHYLPVAPAFDLMVCDPPYAFDAWDDLLANSPAPLVAVESDREVHIPDGWELVRQKRYGSTVVTVITRSSTDPLE